MGPGRAGPGRDAWQPARGVLGTGPRRKPAQQYGGAIATRQRALAYLHPAPHLLALAPGRGAGLLGCAPAFGGSVTWKPRACSSTGGVMGQNCPVLSRLLGAGPQWLPKSFGSFQPRNF